MTRITGKGAGPEDAVDALVRALVVLNYVHVHVCHYRDQVFCAAALQNVEFKSLGSAGKILILSGYS